MIHIVLVDDHALLRQGMRAILEQEPDFQVVGEASDGAEAVLVGTAAVVDPLVAFRFRGALRTAA